MKYVKNLDTLALEKRGILQKMSAAAKDGDTEAWNAAVVELMEFVAESVTAEAGGLIASNDNAILAARGVRVLTSEETQFYEKFITAARSENPKQALTGTDNILPKGSSNRSSRISPRSTRSSP
jgi:hypothetical protein